MFSLPALHSVHSSDSTKLFAGNEFTIAKRNAKQTYTWISLNENSADYLLATLPTLPVSEASHYSLKDNDEQPCCKISACKNGTKRPTC